MATRAENIETRLDAIAAELAAMDATKAGGLPDAPGGIGHVEYRMSLVNEMKMLNAELSRLDGAWEVLSELVAE
jgi:hypothetical protein